MKCGILKISRNQCQNLQSLNKTNEFLRSVNVVPGLKISWVTLNALQCTENVVS